MKVDRAFLRSKVARRIFTLFLLCASLPITVLTIVSLGQVTEQLHDQSQRRLRQTSKAAAMAIYERLLILESEIRIIASHLRTGGKSSLKAASETFDEDPNRKFESFALVTQTGTIPLLHRVQKLPEFDAAEKEHLRSGKTLVQIRRDLPIGIWMARVLDLRHPERGILVAQVAPAHLWGTGYEDTLPGTTEMCVLDDAGLTLFCSEEKLASFLKPFSFQLTRTASGQLEWKDGKTEYLARYWSIPLKFGFFTPKWTVVLSESKASMLAPIANFKQTFFLIIFTSLGVVFLLVVSQIRRILVPLEKLQEGTRRITTGEFQSRVTVASGDEFQELAASFNTMTDRLGRQFHALATMAEIDRAILSVLNTEKIVDKVLACMRDILPCDRVSVALLDPRGKRTGHLSIGAEDSGEKRAEAIELKIEEAGRLQEAPDYLLVTNEDLPGALAPLTERGCRSSLVLPIFVKGALQGFIALGYVHAPQLKQEDLLQARQVTDQVAVALHNSQLYEETKQQAIELEHSNRVKTEFLSVMSHELRTPLTTILGYIEMVKEKLLGDINPRQKDALERTGRQSQILLELINSIMDATKIEAKVLMAETQDIPLKAFLDEVRLVYSAPLDKRLTLRWDYPPSLPTIKTDAEKLRHILQHLISNAIKFTEKGPITVSARHRAESQTLEFTVSDTGIGIPPEQLPSIFEKFRQGDSSETRSHGGVGLGLYIVKTFVELLGGEVKVESRMGEGSAFTVTLPCDLAHPLQEQQALPGGPSS